MPKIQNMMSRDFTVVHNTFLRDKRCKYAARGVLMTMLQKPDDYNFTVRGLASETDDGVTAVSTALKLLESLGYIKRTRITEKGRFVDTLYQISDEPIFKEAVDSDESDTGNTDTEKLIVDDLGAERGTEFALERVHSLVDTRVSSNKPMIVTTNIDINDMGECTDLKKKRTFDRILPATFAFAIKGIS